jgi:hypothetical protein
MLNVFDLHISAPEEKEMSRLCASKTRRNLRTFGRLHNSTVMPVGFTILLLYAEKSREINAMGRVVLRKNVSEKLSIIDPL